MGIELVQQALPDPARLIDAALAQPATLGEELQLCVPLTTNSPIFDEQFGHCEELRAAASSILREHPRVAALNLDLDRRFDMLAFLLSEQYRGDVSVDDISCPLACAVFGTRNLDGITGVQGVPLRISPAWAVRRSSEELLSTSWADVRANLDLPRMAEIGVYKIFDREGEADYIDEWVQRDFANLQRFYQEAASLNFQVLVVRD